jgi:hypothetical protein
MFKTRIGSTPQRPLAAVLFIGLLGLMALPSSAATPTAEYLITFDATWSAATHPTSFPPGPHFSRLIGTLHNDEVSFWQSGGLASSGIEAMAESGSTTPLDNEIGAAVTAGDALEVVGADGIASPGQRTLTVVATQVFSKLTLVSMLAPSPDWFIGVTGLALLGPGPGGDWVNEAVIELHTYDAGTDSGPIYTSPNDDTNPAEGIALITTSPFDGGVPVGTFTITRVDAPPVPVPTLSPLAGVMLVASLVIVRLASRRS